MIIFDTETTGLPKANTYDLSKQPKIIEFAGIKINDDTLEEEERIEFFVNPKEKLQPIITKLTGIKDSDLIDAKVFSYYYPRLVKFWFGQKRSVAHNHPFDTGMMSFDLRRIKKQNHFPWCPVQICTVSETYHLNGYRLKLQKLHQQLFGYEFEKAHRAMNDVEALTKCTIELIKKGIIKL